MTLMLCAAFLVIGAFHDDLCSMELASTNKFIEEPALNELSCIFALKCSHISKSLKEAIDHLFTDHWKKKSSHYHCPKCLKSVRFLVIKRHLMEHYSDFLYECVRCAKNYPTLETFSQHGGFDPSCEIRIPNRRNSFFVYVPHNGIWYCLLNGCTFKSDSNEKLAEHTKTHIEQCGKFKSCPICENFYDLDSDLNKHIYVHCSFRWAFIKIAFKPVEGLYQCNQLGCDISSTEKKDVIKHQVGHMINSICHLCSRDVAVGKLDHLYRHYDIRDFCCDPCSESFVKKSSLDMHCKTNKHKMVLSKKRKAEKDADST